MEKKELRSDIEEISKPENVSMADEWFEIASTDHFWIEWRFKVFRSLLKRFSFSEKKIFEIGCGSGLVMKQFGQQMDLNVDGCDLNAYALNKIEGVGGKKYVYDIYDQDPRLVGQYDMVLLFDVVEHIVDDVDFLAKSVSHLKAGGLVAINVPALMSLFSKYDTQAGHQRRYTKKTLSAICEANNLEVVSQTYWGLSLLPVAYIRKQVLKSTPEEEIIKKGFAPPSKLINSMFKWLMNLETFLFKRPFLGTSLMLVAKVKDNGDPKQ